MSPSERAVLAREVRFIEEGANPAAWGYDVEDSPYQRHAWEAEDE